ncbi:MAG: hypothetical protein NT038_01645 [Euryarchaeota archaeon]|nr:hypothetical protein [Euryarchaeota archaeon]
MIEIKHNKMGFNKEFVEGFARLFFEDTAQKKETIRKENNIVVVQH